MANASMKAPRRGRRPADRLPPRLVEQLLSPLQRYLRIEAISGGVLLTAAIVALGLANSPLAEQVAHFWETPVTIGVGGHGHRHGLGHFVINDILMTLFFFVVGLEVKREIVFGELSDARKAALPVIAAAGGMIVPALVYCLVPTGPAGAAGWAIPMATDIAFVVGAMALLGSRAPIGLKIFLLSLAIADDIGAILVIALFFTEQVAWQWLGLAGLAAGVTLLFARIGVRNLAVYTLVGAVMWLGFFESGVHATLAGVILGLLTPSHAWIDVPTLHNVLDDAQAHSRALRTAAHDSDDAHRGDDDEFDAMLHTVRFAAREAVSPLHRLEHALHPWVAYTVMPLFALANAGVTIDAGVASSPVALAVASGLALGKPIGILGAVWLAVVLGVARLPRGITWRHLIGGACLAGIGFTMSLFLNELAFPIEAQPLEHAAGKLGSLAGSVVSAAIGVAILLSIPSSRSASPTSP